MRTLEHNSVEKSFADWGIAADAATLDTNNMLADLFTCRVAGAAIDGTPLFAFEDQIIVRTGRTYAGSWSGGSIEFTGKCTASQGVGDPGREDVTYQFSGPWYDLEETPYQQTAKTYTGDPDNLVDVTMTELFLFQKVTGPATVIARTNGEQITDILDHVLAIYSAQSMAAPFQKGTISPAVNLPTYYARDLKCAEAIRLCLRCNPDAVIWFDYATTPPTVHCTLRAGMTPATVALADAVKHQAIDIRPRNDLLVRAVVLYFKQLNNDNGYTWIQTTKQVAPGGGPEGGRRVLIQTIDLQGYSRTEVSAKIECRAIENTQAWWANYVPDFKSAKVRNCTFGSMTAKDKDNNTVSLTPYTHTLEDGSIAPWMIYDSAAVLHKKVKIEAEVSYEQWDADTGGRLLKKWLKRTVNASVQVTNAITGTYSATESAIDAEAVPASMATSIYAALSTLQYEGRVALVEEEITVAVGMGNTLHLSGGLAAWATMAATVQQIRRDFATGRTEIVFGPARHLGAADLTEMFLINRNRATFYNPSTQATAKSTGSGSVTLAENNSAENSITSLPEPSIDCVSALVAETTDKVQIKADSAAGKWILHTVDNADATKAGAQVKIQLSECGGKVLSVKEQPICIDGVEMHIMLLCSDPY